jgi:predicted alpha/beta hydrolase family esterase
MAAFSASEKEFIMKLTKIIAPCIILLILIIGITFFLCIPDTDVIFVPGWNSKGHISQLVEKELEETFSAKKVTIHKWKSDVNWEEAKNNAEAEAVLLYKKISEMSPDSQKKLILIAHSLGARIVVRTARLLHEKNINVKQIILLGAAVNHDDEDFKACNKISIQPFINVYNRNDYVLKIAYGNKEKTLAAGFSGISKTGEDKEYQNMKQYRKKSQDDNLFTGFFEHMTYEYIPFLTEIIKGNEQEYIEKVVHHEIKINAGFTDGIFSLPKNTFVIVPDADKEEHYYDWKFCQYNVNSKYTPSIYLIINPYGEIKFTPFAKSQKVWQNIKEQINSQLAASNKSKTD